jgi:hypothetical protein
MVPQARERRAIAVRRGPFLPMFSGVGTERASGLKVN